MAQWYHPVHYQSTKTAKPPGIGPGTLRKDNLLQRPSSWRHPHWSRVMNSLPLWIQCCTYPPLSLWGLSLSFPAFLGAHRLEKVDPGSDLHKLFHPLHFSFFPPPVLLPPQGLLSQEYFEAGGTIPSNTGAHQTCSTNFEKRFYSLYFLVQKKNESRDQFYSLGH